MKFKHIIGLDIGTNSLGWSLIKEYEDGTIKIIKTGVHIFPIGTIVDDKSNKEKTKNERRRSYRGASRMRYRFKLRRKNLKSALSDLGMLPDYSTLSKPYSKKEKKEIINFQRGQSYQLYKLRADAIDAKIKIELQDIGRIFILLNKYRGFKSNAKDKKEDKETGIIKKGIEQLKYFMLKNNAETIGQYFFIMHDKAKKLWENDKWHNFNEPLDERSFINDEEDIILFNSNGIRRHYGRPTARSMYTNEFDIIWAAQKNHYPQIFTGSKKELDEILELPYSERIIALKEFKKTNYWHIKDYCIFYQRPLKSQKKYVSNCQFERGTFETRSYPLFENGIEKIKEKRIWKTKAKKACPKSHPLFQEFRIWQKLHQIRYSSLLQEVFDAHLKIEWLPIIADYLMTNSEIYLSETKKAKEENKYWISQLLIEKGLLKVNNDCTFFIDKTDAELHGDDKIENKITGNTTFARFKEALGEETFNKIKVGHSNIVLKDGRKANLTDLWHHLYIAKDGLFKEEDWLKCILTEKKKWDLTLKQADNLIEKGLVADYGSYSGKVLKAILPFMRKGMNEYEALKATCKGYINDDNTVGIKVQLKDKISQLAYQELRNPVVERALSKTIKLVNAILEKYKDEINRETFEIRIESTRQFKKPRQERENERRKNAEKDKLREEYAGYLTKHKNKLGFTKDIYKYSPVVIKYELWLQMNMNEEDEVFIKEFKSFDKITKQEDRLKHRLWLECGRCCPYTGDIINLTDCFSNEVEIEHIIPLSRSLDDSFNNKTLTYRTTNVRKGSMTPLEFLKKEGGNAAKAFRSRITGKHNYHNFSESKMKLLLKENVVTTNEFSNNQISNTSYIATYTRNKMREVCKNVQFTNGSATAELRNKDWGLSNLLDKIRYEEDFQINIDEYYSNYYSVKKRFLNWYEKKYQTNDFKIDWRNLVENEDLKLYQKETNDDLVYWDDGIVSFNNFRNRTGKKDRSDHRHHAIDAFVIASCAPKIIKELSTYNALREQVDADQRDRIQRQFNYNKLKESITSILVSHSEKQTLIKKRINRIKTKEGIKEQFTYAPQGKLHEESFYAKRNGATVRRVELFNEQSTDKKTLYEKASELDYTVKGAVKWNYIEDKELYLITKTRLEELEKKAFTKEQMINNPFYRVSPRTPEKLTSKKGKKQLPIVKSVRKRFNTDRTLINLPAKDEYGNVINKNRYAENESNFIMVFYRSGNKSFARPISFFNSIKNKKNKNPLLPDEIIYKDVTYGLDETLPWIKGGDIVFICKEEESMDTIEWEDLNNIKTRLYKVKGFSTLITPNPKYGNYEYGNTSLLSIKNVKADDYPSQKKIEEALKLKAFTLSHDKFKGIKVRLNILGEIEAKGEECF